MPISQFKCLNVITYKHQFEEPLSLPSTLRKKKKNFFVKLISKILKNISQFLGINYFV